MSEHTKGRLRLQQPSGGAVFTEDGDRLLLNGVAMPTGNHPKDAEASANARRLVALWNACLGISTAQLEVVAAIDNDWARVAELAILARGTWGRLEDD